jgi:cation:H+ antiporter
MEIIVFVLMFAAGLALMIKGADWITEYGSRLARKLGVSELVIGVTLVAMATSLPELAVSVISAISNAGQIATGTIVGSNIANIALILGLSALACPLVTDRAFLRQGLLTLCFSALVSLLLLGGMVWHEGMFIIICFFAYLAYAVKTRKEGSAGTRKNAGNDRWKYILFCIAGGLVVVGGGELLVASTVNIAQWLGVPEIIIAMIVIAVGTSLPELATSVAAAIKRMRGISLGNIIGSNVFNTAILGISSLFSAVPVTSHVVFLDLPLMLFVTALLMLFMKTGWKLSRTEGLALLAVYGVFIALQFMVG